MQKGVPITPGAVVELQTGSIPDFVIDAFNELIVKNFKHGSGSATVLQDDVENMIKAKYESRGYCETRWLDVEPLFEKIGWKVTYDKPGYNESYPASFLFVPKK
jgi:hypothetical protein